MGHFVPSLSLTAFSYVRPNGLFKGPLLKSTCAIEEERYLARDY